MFWNIVRMPTEVIVFSIIDEGVGSIIAVNSLPSQIRHDKRRFQLKSDKRKHRVERRKKTDRRKGVREGVIVTLSTIENRRKGKDRRQT